MGLFGFSPVGPFVSCVGTRSELPPSELEVRAAKTERESEEKEIEIYTPTSNW